MATLTEKLNQVADSGRVSYMGPTQPKKEDKKKKNLLQSLFSEIGGAGGAAGGAAIGTALLPGVGTLAGALLGGALGSVGGQVAENKAAGESLTKDLVKEGVIGGATSLPIFGAVKGAKAATQALRAAPAGERSLAGALNEGAKAASGITRPATVGGRVQSAGVDLQRNAANTVKVSDSFTQEKSILDALNRNRLGGSAANMYKNVDGVLGNISKDIDATLSTISRTAPREEVINRLRSSVLKTVPDDPSYVREVDRSIDRLRKSGQGDITPAELFALKKDVSKSLGNAFKKEDRGVSLNTREEVDREIWRNLDSEISKLAPEVKSMTLDQSKLITARPGLQKGSEKTVGIPLLGIKSKAISRVSQAAQNKAGRALSSTSEGSGSLKNPLSLTRQGIRQATIGPLAESLVAAPKNMQDSSQQPTGALLNTVAAPQPVEQPQGISNVDIQANVQQILANGGDLKDATEYLGLVQALQEMNAGPQQKPLSAEASKVIANANSGLDSLSQLETILSEDPSARTKSVIPGRSIAGGLGASLLGTSSYDTVSRNIADVITRLRTGAALTDQEERFYKSQLPQAFDPPETVQQKLQMFRNLFGSISNRTGSAGSDTQQILGA